MDVLVTGATGFLGSHLVSRLVQDGNRVKALARKSSHTGRLPKEDVTIVYGDLKDRESLHQAVDGVDVVYHAGAATSGSWREHKETTVRGTEHMLDLSRNAGVERFVHISSVVVYQVHQLEQNSVVDERFPYDPTPGKIGPYAYAKIKAERSVFRFYEKGLPVTVVRPSIIYGPCGRLMFPHVGYFRNGIFLLIGRGNNLLPLTYIDNTVEAILLAATQEKATGQAYNISDGVEITQREYLARYMQETESNCPILPVPLPLLLLPVALVEQLRTLGVLNGSSPSTYGLNSKYKSLRYDSSKAKGELGWEPRVTLEEGLRRTFDWYNSNRRISHREQGYP